MFIRDALIDDLDQLTEHAKKFFEYARFDRYGWEVDDETFKELMRQHIESENGVVLCLMDGLRVVGGIAGGVGPFTYDRNKTMALELYFWVEPEHRGLKSVEMFMMYEKRLQEMGVDYSMLTCPDTEMKDSVDRFYYKNGYVTFEFRFMKAFNYPFGLTDLENE